MEQFLINLATLRPEHPDPSIPPSTSLRTISQALVTCLDAYAPPIPKTTNSRPPSPGSFKIYPPLRRKPYLLNAVYPKLNLVDEIQLPSP